MAVEKVVIVARLSVFVCVLLPCEMLVTSSVFEA